MGKEFSLKDLKRMLKLKKKGFYISVDGYKLIKFITKLWRRVRG